MQIELNTQSLCAVLHAIRMPCYAKCIAGKALVTDARRDFPIQPRRPRKCGSCGGGVGDLDVGVYSEPVVCSKLPKSTATERECALNIGISSSAEFCNSVPPKGRLSDMLSRRKRGARGARRVRRVRGAHRVISCECMADGRARPPFAPWYQKRNGSFVAAEISECHEE